MNGDVLLQRVMLLIPLLLSLSVHEFAHAWSAWKLGDDTAARAGRLSLNPLVHIDLFGTILLPLLGIPFGWAKPVPVNPARFRPGVRMSTGMMLTASAGPISNVVLAVLGSIAYGLLMRFSPQLLLPGVGVGELLGITISINVTLALFNLIPVPPLDGSRIVDGLLPFRFRPAWESVQRFAPFLLIAVIWFGGRLIAVPSRYAMSLLFQLIGAVGA